MEEVGVVLMAAAAVAAAACLLAVSEPSLEGSRTGCVPVQHD